MWNKVRDAEQINTNRDKAQEIIDGQAETIKAIKNRYALKANEAKNTVNSEHKKPRTDTEEKETIKQEIAGIEEQIRELQHKLN